MPHPARTTSLLSNFLGLHAKPKRGARPHCRPVRVELLTPLVGNFVLLPATMKPFESERVGRGVVISTSRIEVIDFAVLLRQTAVIVPAQSSRDAQVGAKLEFVLDIFARLVGAIVAIRVALQDTWSR